MSDLDEPTALFPSIILEVDGHPQTDVFSMVVGPWLNKGTAIEGRDSCNHRFGDAGVHHAPNGLCLI
jgi:hypothetical protein